LGNDEKVFKQACPNWAKAKMFSVELALTGQGQKNFQTGLP